MELERIRKLEKLEQLKADCKVSEEILKTMKSSTSQFTMSSYNSRNSLTRTNNQVYKKKHIFFDIGKY